LWRAGRRDPAAPWYIESGQGMGATLGIADDRSAYSSPTVRPRWPSRSACSSRRWSRATSRC
jgi:hypothetical protein